MVMSKGIPVTVSDVKVIYHDNRIVQVDSVLLKEVDGSLIAVGIDIDYEVGITVAVKCKDIDVSVIDNVKPHYKSHF